LNSSYIYLSTQLNSQWLIIIIIITIITTTTTTTTGKDISVTGRGGPQRCEMSRLPHFLENRLRDGCEADSLAHLPLFTSKKIPGTHFC
jgi:hypothetical protein